MVDALWNEFFPDATTKVCPFFDHFNDQYRDSGGFPDVMTLKQTPPALTANHVIIAGPDWKNDGSLEAKYMMQQELWNGVTWLKTSWDGLLSSVIAEHKEQLSSAKPEYAALHTPTDDWLVVTVDYHS